MGATFTRVNSVIVDPTQTKIRDAYVDLSLSPGSSSAANLASTLNTTATYGQLFRGMPVFISRVSGKIVPPSAGNGTSSTTGSTTSFGGVLISDLTSYIVARGTKLALALSGRIRSYAGAVILPGDEVKVDTSANFSGFVTWAKATDDVALRVGRAWPLDDGSTTGTPATTIAQGDTIFVDLY
jgi:hypothetical protein